MIRVRGIENFRCPAELLRKCSVLPEKSQK
uniref:Uncharacterized protein n=1 Tax=Anguilla anguilla TaxID=7936 RepID=A0A0E9SGM0_ANGAN